MSNFFSKFLGKVALMTAAALWAGCDDSDKKAGDTVAQKGIREEQQQVQEPPTKTFVGSAKKVKSKYLPVRDSSITSETISGVTALYGVLRPYEIFTPDEPRKIHQSRPIPRCLVKELTEEDVVVGEGSDIDAQTLLKVFRQRSPSIRHICNKNLYTNLKYRAKRTKEFEGTIVFEMKIAPSGKVENVEIKSSMARFNKEMMFAPSGKVENVEIRSSMVQFSEEIRKSITRWMFPKTQNGGTFTFPVNLYEVFPSSSSSASEQPLPPTE